MSQSSSGIWEDLRQANVYNVRWNVDGIPGPGVSDIFDPIWRIELTLDQCMRAEMRDRLFP